MFLQKLLGIVQSPDFKIRIRQGAETIEALKQDTDSYCFGIEISNFMYNGDKLQLLKTNPSEYFYQLSLLLQNSRVLEVPQVRDAYFETIIKVLGDLSDRPVAQQVRKRQTTGRSNKNNNRYRPAPYGGGKTQF